MVFARYYKSVSDSSQSLRSVTVTSKRGCAVLDVIDPVPAFYTLTQRPAQPLRTDQPPKKRQRIVVDKSPVQQNHHLDTSTGSPDNLRLAKKWLSECSETHPQCKPSYGTIPKMPTRWLDIQTKEVVILKVADTSTEEAYVALSHAWGKGPHFRTVQDNYQAHLHGIPTESLPSTFRQATQVARDLGYKYIWIDSLCIIQDDPNDLNKELPLMGDIYRHADLTIYAQNSRNGYSGFFHQRNPQHYRPCSVPITTTTKCGSTTEQVTLATTFTGLDNLQNRGWVLQERVLSCRCLMFGRQMAWACTTGEAQETRPVLRDRPAYVKGSVLANAEDLRAVLNDSAPTNPSNFKTWYTMLEEYSKKNLTFKFDNLKAVSGLAALFHQSLKSEYLAGLWRDDLPRGLAWYVATNDSRPASENPDGPSWSWASVGKVRVQFRSQTGVSSHVDDLGVEVIDAGVVLDTPLNPFGPCATGFLKLKGVCKKAKVRYTAANAKQRNRLMYGSQGSTTGVSDVREQPRFPAMLCSNVDKTIGDVALDRPWTDDIEIKDVWCLLLDKQVLREGYSGTVLVLIKNEQEYIRFGLGFVKDDGVKWIGFRDNHQLKKGDIRVV